MRKRGKIDADSLPLLPLEDSAAPLLARFEALWAHHALQTTADGHALRWTVLRVLSPRFPLIGCWVFLDAAANFSQPFIIAALVRNLRLGSTTTFGTDAALVVLIAFNSMLGAATQQQVLWMGARVGMRAKITLSAAIYKKTLRLSNAAASTTNAGQATNLVAIDASRLEVRPRQSLLLLL